MEQRILERSVRLPSGGAVTGWAALRLWGGGFFDGRGPLGELPVPLVIPAGTDLRRAPGDLVAREQLADDELAIVQGIPCTAPGRALLDEVKRRPDLREAVAAVDMVLAAGIIPPRDLGLLVDRYRGRAGVRLLEAACHLADPRSRSPQETRLRLVWVLDAKYPRPLCNPDLADLDGRFLGTPDLLSRELGVVGEYDGAFHRGRERHRADVRREDLFRRAGLEVFTVVGADLRDTALVVGRMRAAVQRAAESGRPRAWMVRR